MSILSQKALVVYLSISQWTGRKLDKTATASVASTFTTDKSAGRYTKKLLPESAELKKITNAAGALRNYFYQETLPWFSDGARIIASKNYLNFTSNFRRLENDYQQAINDFLSTYDAQKAAAQAKLGALYNPADYPSLWDIKDSFRCELSFMPLPSVEDFRTEISDDEKTAFLAKIKEVETSATRDAVKKLFEVVSLAANKLATPDAIFKDSLISKVNAACGLLDRVNVLESREVEDFRTQVGQLVETLDAKTLRQDSTERDSAAKKLAEISDKMRAFMGEVNHE